MMKSIQLSLHLADVGVGINILSLKSLNSLVKVILVAHLRVNQEQLRYEAR